MQPKPAAAKRVIVKGGKILNQEVNSVGYILRKLQLLVLTESARRFWLVSALKAHSLLLQIILPLRLSLRRSFLELEVLVGVLPYVFSSRERDKLPRGRSSLLFRKAQDSHQPLIIIEAQR